VAIGSVLGVHLLPRLDLAPPSGSWSETDFDVLDREREVGRPGQTQKSIPAPARTPAFARAGLFRKMLQTKL
jgi:hypothetical protein